MMTRMTTMEKMRKVSTTMMMTRMIRTFRRTETTITVSLIFIMLSFLLKSFLLTIVLVSISSDSSCSLLSAFNNLSTFPCHSKTPFYQPQDSQTGLLKTILTLFFPNPEVLYYALRSLILTYFVLGNLLHFFILCALQTKIMSHFNFSHLDGGMQQSRHSVPEGAANSRI